MIRISIPKTKYIRFHFPDLKDFALFVANFVVVIYALSRKVKKKFNCGHGKF